MNTLKQLNLAMHYIEAHLADDIDFDKVAQLAYCSEYHFRRMFSFLAGITLTEYIRRRRLSLAAVELRDSDVKVIDLAVKYGYASADAFSRAFQAWHGLTPTEARITGVSLKAIPPISFQLTVYGGSEMDYRIVQKEAFYITGLKKRITLIYEGVNPEIVEMAKSLTEADFEELKALNNAEPSGILNVSVNFSGEREEGSRLDQYIGVATTQSQSDRWSVLPVAASEWAVFTVRGEFPKVLQDTWARIYTEWFPMMDDYQSNEGPSLVWTADKDRPLTDYHNEIWIPISKK